MKTVLQVPLFSAITAMILAQVSKVFFEHWKRKSWNWSLLWRTGGMPSSHTAMVVSLTAVLWMSYGWRSPWVSISAVSAMIVMHDAIGVRRQAGEQALVIHDLIAQVQEAGLQVAASELIRGQRWRRQGHKPLEVVGGFVTGVLVAWIVFLIANPPSM